MLIFDEGQIWCFEMHLKRRGIVFMPYVAIKEVVQYNNTTVWLVLSLVTISPEKTDAAT